MVRGVAGKYDAEVTLAKLYLIGGGVPKSCDQAKVLLQAAAKKGNGEAIDKLSQISRQGCPNSRRKIWTDKIAAGSNPTNV